MVVKYVQFSRIPGAKLEAQKPVINHNFVSADNRWKLNLTNTFISLSTVAYPGWEEFCSHFDHGTFPGCALVHILGGKNPQVRRGNQLFTATPPFCSRGPSRTACTARWNLSNMNKDVDGAASLGKRSCACADAVDMSVYADADSVQAYAAGAMNWAIANSLIKGDNNGNLTPRATATRAQVATILQAFAPIAPEPSRRGNRPNGREPPPVRRGSYPRWGRRYQRSDRP